jgi:beta-xylosidase
VCGEEHRRHERARVRRQREAVQVERAGGGPHPRAAGYPAFLRGFFTGAFVGLHCEDISGDGCHADFDYFTYEPA